MELTEQQKQQFREVVWNFFATHQREMPWREDPNPYWVVVSEIMLQQTQVERVTPKFQQFIQQFPDFGSLANSPLGVVVQCWVGLGYNRRAQYLHRLAQVVTNEHQGLLPKQYKTLIKLPGIGPNTAGAICNYAFNIPIAFVETNIRTVFLYHFYPTAVDVDDTKIKSLVEQTIERETSRQWFWALMDYGAHLKKTRGNNIQNSKHYKKQSRFEGSVRQVRGRVIAELAIAPRALAELEALITDVRLTEVLAQLQAEKLIKYSANRVQLT